MFLNPKPLGGNVEIDDGAMCNSLAASKTMG